MVLVKAAPVLTSRLETHGYSWATWNSIRRASSS